MNSMGVFYFHPNNRATKADSFLLHLLLCKNINAKFIDLSPFRPSGFTAYTGPDDIVVPFGATVLHFVMNSGVSDGPPPISLATL